MLSRMPYRFFISGGNNFFFLHLEMPANLYLMMRSIIVLTKASIWFLFLIIDMHGTVLQKDL